MKSKFYNSLNEAFTLIELLIVVAILGVLAMVALVTINPPEQLARSRDAGRISAVLQLGKAVQSFYTANSGNYPTTSSWGDELSASGYPQSFPVGLNYVLSGTSPCTTNSYPTVLPTYCYEVDLVGNAGSVVFATFESSRNRSKCPTGETAYFAYSTQDGRGGIICSATELSPWEPGTQTYID